jgi:pilus assembly protein CpaF
MFSLKEKVFLRGSSNQDFFEFVEEMGKRINKKMVNDDEFLSLAQRALLGEQVAVDTCMKHIEQQMREYPFSGQLPQAFKGIHMTSAIYHEWIGYSVITPWMLNKDFANSSKIQIVGTNISYARQGEYHPYPYSFSSLERVQQLQRTLVRHDPRVRLDAAHPSAELKIDDPIWPGRFIRVAMFAPKRVWEGFNTITLRRQIVENMSLEEQAGTGLIGEEAVPLFRDLVMTSPNIVVSGPVESGKTTFANTLVSEQLKQADHSLGVPIIEQHPESTLPYTELAKRHRIIPIQAKAEELMDVAVQLLRHDPDFVFMSEMRWAEWGVYNFVGEKGYRNLIGTYHTKDAEDIPYQGAFAVYAQTGGNLKGHLMATLKSCEIVAILEPQRHGKKKLIRLSEIRYEPDSEVHVKAHDFIRWDPDKRQWLYSAEISDSLWQRMIRANKTAAERFRDRLIKLARERPNHNPFVVSRKCQVVLEGAE